MSEEPSIMSEEPTSTGFFDNMNVILFWPLISLFSTKDQDLNTNEVYKFFPSNNKLISLGDPMVIVTLLLFIMLLIEFISWVTNNRYTYELNRIIPSITLYYNSILTDYSVLIISFLSLPIVGVLYTLWFKAGFISMNNTFLYNLGIFKISMARILAILPDSCFFGITHVIRYFYSFNDFYKFYNIENFADGKSVIGKGTSLLLDWLIYKDAKSFSAFQQPNWSEYYGI